jgi:hypothetical protein
VKTLTRTRRETFFSKACFLGMSKKSEFLIGLTTGLVLVYTVMGTLPVTFLIVFALFLVVSGLTIVMVITILKDTSNLSGRKFDDYFYEDSSAKRIAKED